MRVYDKMNNAGSWSISSRIEQMLEDCGECYIDDMLIQDNGSNSQSYQGYCCEEFGGEYFEFSDAEQNYCEGSDATWMKLCSACTGTTDTDGDGIADECDDCNNLSGDINDDMMLNVLDVVSLVNIILMVTENPSACALSDADLNNDDIINVQDIIMLINQIVNGQARSANDMILKHTDLQFKISKDDLILSFTGEQDISGLQLSFPSSYLLDIKIDNLNNSLYSKANVHNGMEYYVAFSFENESFKTLDLIIENGSYLSANDVHVLLASPRGDQVPVVYNAIEVDSFAIDSVYPNPFNPSTEINYYVERDGDMNISVYNIIGQKVAELFNGYQSIGSQKIIWDAHNLSSGIYYIQMDLNGQFENYKAVLLK